MPQIRAKMPDGTVQSFDTIEAAEMAADLMRSGALSRPTQQPSAPQAASQNEPNIVQRFLRAGAAGLRQPAHTGLTGVFGDLMQLGRNEGANALEALSSPRENASTLGALAAQFIPPVRAAAQAPRIATGLQALRQLGSSAWRSGVGGAVATGADALASGDTFGQAADKALGAGLFEGGMDVVTGGLTAGAANTMRGTGRQFAYKALAPTDPDLANVHLAFRDKPSEFHRAGDRFLAGQARRGLKDILQGEAESMPGVAAGQGVGGIRSALDAIKRADASDAMQMNVINETLAPPLMPGLGRAPRAEFAIDLTKVAGPAREAASAQALLREGADPQGVAKTVWSTVNRFLRRPQDERVFATNRPLLEAPKVDIKIGGWEAPRGAASGQLADLTVPSAPMGSDVAVPAAAIPNLERGPRVTEELGGLPVGRGRVLASERMLPGILRGRVPGDAETGVASIVKESGIGNVMASHTPTSVLPTPPQFLGESSRLPEVAPQPTSGTMKMALSKAQELYPDLFPKASRHNVVGMDVAADIIKAIDRDLNREMQSRIGALGAGQRYVPSQKEETLMAIRSALREAVNETAPMGKTLAGEPITLADILKQQQQDIVLRDLKARATGEDVASLRARGHFNPQTGRPGLSVYENIARFGGAAANPMMKAGATGLRATDKMPSALRLAYLLSSQPSGDERLMENVNLSGFRR